MNDIVKDGGIEAERCGDDFSNCSRPMTDDERFFMEVYHGYHDGLSSTVPGDLTTPPMSAYILGKIDDLENRHPVVEKAFQDVLQNPEKFDIKGQENGWFERMIGLGDHSFENMTSDERFFMKVYHGLADRRPGDITPPLTAYTLRKIEDLENRHPVIEKAFQDVLQNPEKFGLKVEKNGLYKRMIGLGDHSFKDITGKPSEPSPAHYNPAPPDPY